MSKMLTSGGGKRCKQETTREGTDEIRDRPMLSTGGLY